MKKILFICMTAILLLTACDTEDAFTFIDYLIDELSQSEVTQKELDATNMYQDIDLHEMQVHYMDVGQADASLIRFYDDDAEVNILYDTGDWRGDEVVPYLQALQIDTVDLVIISHPHADHMGQLKEVIDAFTVEEIWMTANEANTDLFATTMKKIVDQDIHYLEPTAGDLVTIGPLTIEILHPGETLTGDFNRDSLSARFTYGEQAFLFTGDAIRQSEDDMMDAFKDLQADFLHLGHHGSRTSSSKAFVRAVDPSYAIYSAGLHNKYDHPHEETIVLFNKLQIPIYGTDQDGHIIVTTDGTNIEIDTYSN